MYRNPPRVESRGLGLGLLAGFLGWLVAIVLEVGIAKAFLVEQVGYTLWLCLLVAAFVLPVGLSAWLVRPTSFGVPVIFALLSIPGWTIAYEARSAVLAVIGGVPLGEYLHFLGIRWSSPLKYVWAGFPWLPIIAGVIVFVLSLGAVLVGRSRARRLAPYGPPPGPYGGGPYGPAAQAGPAYPPAPASGPVPAYPPGQPVRYGSQYGPGYAAPQGPPPALRRPPAPPPPPAPAAYGPPPGRAPGPAPYPAAPVPAPPPVAGPPPVPGPPPAPAGGQPPPGTRRLDPDEFDQLIYEEEQERRAREDG